MKKIARPWRQFRLQEVPPTCRARAQVPVQEIGSNMAGVGDVRVEESLRVKIGKFRMVWICKKLTYERKAVSSCDSSWRLLSTRFSSALVVVLGCSTASNRSPRPWVQWSKSTSAESLNRDWSQSSDTVTGRCCQSLLMYTASFIDM